MIKGKISGRNARKGKDQASSPQSVQCRTVRTARQLSARRPTQSCTSLRIFFESHEQSVI
jgi:hypothetical protein